MEESKINVLKSAFDIAGTDSTKEHKKFEASKLNADSIIKEVGLSLIETYKDARYKNKEDKLMATAMAATLSRTSSVSILSLNALNAALKTDRTFGVIGYKKPAPATFRDFSLVKNLLEAVGYSFDKMPSLNRDITIAIAPRSYYNGIHRTNFTVEEYKEKVKNDLALVESFLSGNKPAKKQKTEVQAVSTPQISTDTGKISAQKYMSAIELQRFLVRNADARKKYLESDVLDEKTREISLKLDPNLDLSEVEAAAFEEIDRTRNTDATYKYREPMKEVIEKIVSKLTSLQIVSSNNLQAGEIYLIKAISSLVGVTPAGYLLIQHDETTTKVFQALDLAGKFLFVGYLPTLEAQDMKYYHVVTLDEVEAAEPTVEPTEELMPKKEKDLTLFREVSDLPKFNNITETIKEELLNMSTTPKSYESMLTNYNNGWRPTPSKSLRYNFKHLNTKVIN